MSFSSIKCLFVFVLLLFFSHSSFSKDSAGMPNIFYANVEVTNVHFSMKINGVELAKLKDKQKYMVEMPVTGWVQSGENQLSVDVFALPEEDKIRGEVSIDIYIHDNTSEYPKAKETYLSYRFPNDDSKKDKNEKFQSQEAVFSIAESTPTKLWTEATVIESLSDKDKIEIMYVVNVLGESVVKGEDANIADALTYKIQEEAFMRGVEFSQSLSVAKKSFEMLRKHGALERNDLEPDDVVFDVVGNKKVVYVSTKSGVEALSFSLGENLIQIPIYVSKIDGSWKIVR